MGKTEARGRHSTHGRVQSSLHSPHRRSFADTPGARVRTPQVASRFTSSPNRPRADEGDVDETADSGGVSAVPKTPASGKASSNKVKVAVAALEDAALHGEAGTERTLLLRSLCKALGACASPCAKLFPPPRVGSLSNPNSPLRRPSIHGSSTWVVLEY
jgi:hypothetical protein